jgi:beta-lactamase regulating signal transducer with metallopeptidase domain
MFAVRGISVSFTVFFIVYTMLSLMVCLTWRSFAFFAKNLPSSRRANFLFALRIAPLTAAAGLTLVFAVPSFLLLEPRAVQESMGFSLILLGSCGAIVVLRGVLNAGFALVSVSSMVASWSADAQMMDRDVWEFPTRAPILRTSAAAPPLSTVGILRPRILLSHAADSVLTERERLTALQHEMVHVRRHDNLRKLILCAVVFPGMAPLENEWCEASEQAADEAAVASPVEALDLAAAVIKLSSLNPLRPPAPLTTALIEGSAKALNARVERLIAWTEPRLGLRRKHRWAYFLCAAGCATALMLSYGDLLVKAHAATEWLVR